MQIKVTFKRTAFKFKVQLMNPYDKFNCHKRLSFMKNKDFYENYSKGKQSVSKGKYKFSII